LDHHRIAVVDLETSGLDPVVDEILECGIVLFDFDRGPQLSQELLDFRLPGFGRQGRPRQDVQLVSGTRLFYGRYAPARDPRTFHPKALERNGLKPENWLNCSTFDRLAAEEIRALLEEKPTLFVGHNSAFDRDFLDSPFRRFGVDRPYAFRRTICTMSLGFHHLAPLGLASLSLEALCDAMGIENPKAHTALADAIATAEVFHRLSHFRLRDSLQACWRLR
jgi:DNA polymerase III epsilon subunit-like protein